MNSIPTTSSEPTALIFNPIGMDHIVAPDFNPADIMAAKCSLVPSERNIYYKFMWKQIENKMSEPTAHYFQWNKPKNHQSGRIPSSK